MLKKVNEVISILSAQGCENLQVDKRAKKTEIYYNNNKINILANGNILIADKYITIPYSDIKSKKFNISYYFELINTYEKR